MTTSHAAPVHMCEQLQRFCFGNKELGGAASSIAVYSNALLVSAIYTHLISLRVLSIFILFPI